MASLTGRALRQLPEIMQTLRWTGIALCAALAGVSLVYGIVDLTEGSARGVGSNSGWAALFGVSAVLLWRRVGWRRAGAVFGVLALGLVVLYIVLVALRAHGYLGGP